MHKRPLAVIAVFFMLGIVLSKFLPDSLGFPHIFTVTLIFIALTLTLPPSPSLPAGKAGLRRTSSPEGRGRIANISLLLSVTSFSALLYINSNTFPNDHIGNVLKEERLKTEIVGIVRSPALTRKPYYGKISSTYLFELEQVEDRNVQGLSQIRIQTEKDYEYGDRLLVNGTIRKPSLPKEKKDFNYREYLARQNIFALINTKENNITVLSHNYKSNPILKYTYLIREKLKNQILEKMPLDSGAFLRAILLGDRSELPRAVQAAFKNSGTMHILAISGLHVGIIASVIIYLLKFLRLGRNPAYIFTILFLIIFSLLTLSRPSVVRATVMACVFLIGMLLGRRVDVYNSLGAASLFILLKNPKDLFSVGFQLSFLAVLSIICFAPRFMRLARQDTNFYIKRYLYTPLAVSISAWLGTFPLILYYFRIITPVAIVANIFIIPALFALLVGGMGFILLGWIGFAGTILAGLNNLCANTIFFLAEFFSSLKFGHFHL